jgi:hypothetical protein
MRRISKLKYRRIEARLEAARERQVRLHAYARSQRPRVL